MNIRAPIGRTGYGVAGLNIYKEFARRHPKTIYWPIGQPAPETQDDADLIQQGLNNQNTLQPHEPSLTVWHEFDLGIHPLCSKTSALVFFEKDQLVPRAVNHLEHVNQLFVASKWARDLLYQKYNILSTVVPMGVDLDVFSAHPPQAHGPYCFFSIGKIEVRKGHHKLAEWFNKAFTPNDDVRLIINWHNPFMSPEEHKEWEKKYKNTPMGDKILFVNTKTQEEVANLIAQCHCGVFPTASEGFGLNILEAIAMNKPVITTNYSAMPDYCTAQNCFLCEPDGLEQAYDGKWFLGDANWAKRGKKYEEELIHYMRHAYNSRLIDNPGVLNVLETYNWDNAYQTIYDGLY